MDVESDVGGGTGSTRRRRERRLRQFLGRERLSVAMALSEFTHDTSRGQRKDRARGEAREVWPRSGSASSPPRVPGHPVWLSHGGPQDQQLTMEQAANFAPMVQILDAPVAQVVEQFAEPPAVLLHAHDCSRAGYRSA